MNEGAENRQLVPTDLDTRYLRNQTQNHVFVSFDFSQATSSLTATLANTHIQVVLFIECYHFT